MLIAPTQHVTTLQASVADYTTSIATTFAFNTLHWVLGPYLTQTVMCTAYNLHPPSGARFCRWTVQYRCMELSKRHSKCTALQLHEFSCTMASNKRRQSGLEADMKAISAGMFQSHLQSIWDSSILYIGPTDAIRSETG